MLANEWPHYTKVAFNVRVSSYDNILSSGALPRVPCAHGHDYFQMSEGREEDPGGGHENTYGTYCILCIIFLGLHVVRFFPMILGKQKVLNE